MHVLHLVDSLALGGAERMLVEIANQTVRDGHRASVCVSRSDLTLADQLERSIELVVLGREHTFQIAPLTRLVRWIRKHDVDVIHCHGRSSFSLACVLALSRAITQPLLLHDHYGVEIDTRVPRWFTIARHRCAAYVGVYPNHLTWAARAGIPSERARVIPNAFDVSTLERQRRTGAPLRTEDTALIAIGGIRREKAFDVLIDAMTQLRSSVELFIVGADSDRAYAQVCREQVERAGLTSRVHFLGQRTDALPLAMDAALAVHSSRSESGPLVLAEYAVMGVPFVATRVGGIAELLATKSIGSFVSADAPAELARCIDQQLEIPRASRIERAQRMRSLARSLFDIKSAISSWYDVYESVISR